MVWRGYYRLVIFCYPDTRVFECSHSIPLMHTGLSLSPGSLFLISGECSTVVSLYEEVGPLRYSFSTFHLTLIVSTFTHVKR